MSPLTARQEMMARNQGKREQDNAEVEELLNRIRRLSTAQNLCDLVSELISSGVEKCVDGDASADLYKDLFLIVSHALSKVDWAALTPSFAELSKV